MAKMHQVGKVHHGVSFEQLSALFKEKSWAGATTNDRISPDVIALMDEPRANAIRALEINYSDGKAIAKVNNWDSRAQPVPVDFYALCEKGLEKKIGLPLPIQEVLARDLEEYYKLTGRSATTKIYIGHRLETDWHTTTPRGRQTPLMVRDLSGHGMYYAEALSKDGYQVESDNSALADDWMVSLKALQQAFNDGSLAKRQLQPGERIFFNQEVLAREHWVSRDGEPMVRNVRALTATYSF